MGLTALFAKVVIEIGNNKRITLMCQILRVVLRGVSSIEYSKNVFNVR